MKFFVTLFVIGFVAAADVSSSSKQNSESDCPKTCARTWHPVCALVDGTPVSISNKCTLESLIHCVNDDNKVWEFLHNGPCRIEDETSEEEESAWVENEDNNENHYVYEMHPEDQINLEDEYEFV